MGTRTNWNFLIWSFFEREIACDRRAVFLIFSKSKKRGLGLQCFSANFYNITSLDHYRKFVEEVLGYLYKFESLDLDDV